MRLLCSRISAWKRSMTRSRAPMGVWRHVAKARCAAPTAAATSLAVASGTRASTSCVAGLTTLRNSVADESTHSPLISSGTVGTALSVFGTALMVVSGRSGSVGKGWWDYRLRAISMRWISLVPS
ncbi:hypothetical protein D9M72_350230 [compost metagenome]